MTISKKPTPSGRMKSFTALAVAALALAGLLALPATAEAHNDKKNNDKKNMKLVGLHDIQGRSIYKGHVQEQNGRFIAYLGHHGGSAFNPLTGMFEDNGVSILDVTNPKNPVYLKHLPPTPPGNQSRNLQTCDGNDLTGPNTDGKFYLQREVGGAADVHEVWDVTIPEEPVFVSTIQQATATHKNWWECSTGIAYLTSGVDGWNARVLSIFDLNDPANPVFIRNYIGLPGAQPGGDLAGRRDTSIHEPLYLDDKVYLAYGTGSDGIFQILDNEVLLTDCVFPDVCATNPTAADLLRPLISRLDWPDFQGVHTAVPIPGMDLPEFEDFDAGTPRDFVVVINESVRNECGRGERFAPMHQMVYMVDITDPAHPIPVSTYFVPAGGEEDDDDEVNFCKQGGRFGAHAMQWNLKETIYRKSIAWVSYFNAGVRGVDIRDPYNPKEVAFFIPEVTENTTERCVTVDGVEECKTAIQTNNVDVDDRGFVYLFDRANTGLHILKVTGKARKIANFPDDDDD